MPASDVSGPKKGFVWTPRTPPPLGYAPVFVVSCYIPTLFVKRKTQQREIARENYQIQYFIIATSTKANAKSFKIVCFSSSVAPDFAREIQTNDVIRISRAVVACIFVFVFACFALFSFIEYPVYIWVRWCWGRIVDWRKWDGWIHTERTTDAYRINVKYT